MAGPKVLALILAGGEGGRLGALTDVRAKPAMPFGGVYRLIDFPLSNCVHSGISDVWVLQQYQPHALNEHLSNGRPWDLDRTYGGLKILQPYLGDAESGWYEGNADALYRNAGVIESFDPDLVLVLSADHVYKLDYRDVVGRHLEQDAGVTLVTTRVPREQASRFGTVEVDRDGRVTGFEYKADEPASDIATAEVFVYTAETLLASLAELADGGDDGSGLTDFGAELLPKLVDEGEAWEYRLDGYWRDVGTVESYWEAHMELLAPDPRLVLDDPPWPILTYGIQHPPARIERSASIDSSWISSGCAVRGQVERSVLAPRVVVEEGAVVRDSIVFQEAVIRRGSAVERAILDDAVEVEEGARVGGDDGDITVVARGTRVAAADAAGAGRPGTRAGS